MKKLIVITALLASVASFAQTSGKPADTSKNHFQLYGFIRNYFAYDTRESVAGTEDFYYTMPKDENIVDGTDLNAQSQFRFAALTSRVGLKVSGYEFNGVKMGAQVEADFYAGLSTTDKVTGTAQMRLRQAFVTFGKNIWNIKAGQAWHPMAADMPDIMALNSGNPFGPFSRTPQVTLGLALPENFSLTASAIWQMQYTSNGPEGSAASYIKYGCTPEFYFGVNYTPENALFRLGVDVLSIKPRHNDGKKKVSDRITTFSPFLYAQYRKGLFSAKLKTIFAEAGEHMWLNGGYGISSIEEDGSFKYTPTRNSSTWVSLSYGKKLQGVLFGGYVRNFGAKDSLLEDSAHEGYASVSNLYFHKNSFANMNRMWRVTPGLIYNLGKLAFGLECEITGVQYGKYLVDDGEKYIGVNGLAEDGLHWITNTRLLGTVKFTF